MRALPFALNDLLSITAAAREAGGRTALLDAAQRYTLAALAELALARLAQLVPAPTRPYALVGSNTLDAAITLYALLEARVPVLMLRFSFWWPSSRWRSLGC